MPARMAARPVMTPREVVRMLVPSPPSTGGTSVLREYTRRPGRLMRSTPLSTFSPFGPYFRTIRMTCRGASGLGGLGRFLLDHLEALDVSLVFENLGNLDLQLRRGHIDSGVLRNDGIAKAREHIGNRVCHISCSLFVNCYFSS